MKCPSCGHAAMAERPPPNVVRYQCLGPVPHHWVEPLGPPVDVKDAVISRVSPGDTIVLRVARPLPYDMSERLWKWAHEMWPDNTVGVLNHDGIEIEIVRPADE